MGNTSIDLSLANIWRSWFCFKKGKRKTKELEIFSYYLERNISALYFELNTSRYRHGEYKKFIVTDNKRREISVASIRDKLVHWLLYEYLIAIYDKVFIYDAWSCRKGKGLLGAIERTQKFLRKYPDSFIWRADIKRFFDNVDHRTLLKIISMKIKDAMALALLKKVIASYSIPTREGVSVKGIPIGNLTSQIFANTYLNELDRIVKHAIKPRAYLRYGDDFIVISESLERLKQIRRTITEFLQEKLRLEINAENDIIIKAKWGLKFLGVTIFPKSRRLQKRNWNRAQERLDYRNVSSYSGLVGKHCNTKKIKEFNWLILEKLNEIL